MEFRILGPVEVVGDDGGAIRIAAPKVRALLVRLLLDRNRVVSAGTLIDDLWDERPPATAAKTLQVYVSQLRKLVGDDRIETVHGGYRLHADAGELDVDAFEQLVADGRPRDALALWRGPALADAGDEAFARRAAERLEEARLAALEARIDEDLEGGRHSQLVGELEELTQLHPLDEKLRAQLMLALYRSGRQAEALEVYRATRERLAHELGLEPGLELRELEQRILRHDPQLRTGRFRTIASTHAVRRRWPVLAVLALLVAVGLVGGWRRAHEPKTDTDVGVFTVKVENILGEARVGRVAVRAALTAALRCRVTASEAAAEIDDVTANRNSLLQQIAALSVPADERARRAASLLQQAVAASFTADVAYRRDLLRAERCPPGLRAEPGARAERLKVAFVDAFDPLAERFGLRTWRASEF